MNKTNFKQKILIFIAQALCISTLTIQLAHAANQQILVDSTADQPTPGLTTFREAIEEANLTNQPEIIFDQNVFNTPQVITLENGEIRITGSLLISGPGADLLTIDANNLSRVLNIDDKNITRANVEIIGITFTNGRSSARGGCIISNESLKLRSSETTGCFSEGSGGGLHNNNANNVEIENSSFINNTSESDGGGFFLINGIGHKIINSTFSGNIAPNRGGGFAMINTSGINNVVNSTFSENQARRGAGIFSNRPLNVLNSTIINNTGPGVQLAQDAIQNNIIVSNTGLDCIFVESGINNQNILDTDGSCGVDAVNHITVADPLLAPLEANGGLSLTHLPLDGSPVIDMGDDDLCAEIDQRGRIRPQDGDSDGARICDIGAVEVGNLTDQIFKDGFDFSDCSFIDGLKQISNRGCR